MPGGELLGGHLVDGIAGVAVVQYQHAWAGTGDGGRIPMGAEQRDQIGGRLHERRTILLMQPVLRSHVHQRIRLDAVDRIHGCGQQSDSRNVVDRIAVCDFLRQRLTRFLRRQLVIRHEHGRGHGWIDRIVDRMETTMQPGTGTEPTPSGISKSQLTVSPPNTAGATLSG